MDEFRQIHGLSLSENCFYPIVFSASEQVHRTTCVPHYRRMLLTQISAEKRKVDKRGVLLSPSRSSSDATEHSKNTRNRERSNHRWSKKEKLSPQRSRPPKRSKPSTSSSSRSRSHSHKDRKSYKSDGLGARYRQDSSARQSAQSVVETQRLETHLLK